MKSIAVLALIGLISKTETINAINLNRFEKSNICISEIHEDTESLLGLDSTISMLEDPTTHTMIANAIAEDKTEAPEGEKPAPKSSKHGKDENVTDYLR